jgi:hypothetical protein
VKHLRCRSKRVLPARLAGPHAEECLRCQAGAARERLIRRQLAALSDEVFGAPPHLAAAVMAHLGEQTAPAPTRRAILRTATRHAATAGVAAAATAAVLSGLARRRSRLVG